MAGLLDGIMEQLGTGGVAQISKSLGVDPSEAGSAVAAALPAILAGLAHNTSNQQGAAALSNALDNHNPSIFDQLGGLLSSGGGDGAAILGHILGNNQPQVAEHVAQSSGLDPSLITKLLPILAPLVMGYLSHQKQTQQLDPSGLGQVLGDEHATVQAQQPGLGGLASILGSGGASAIISDVLGKLTGH